MTTAVSPTNLTYEKREDRFKAKGTHKQFTKRREEFCRHYTAIGKDSYYNGSLSARLAGFSARSCGAISNDLLQMPHIKQRIEDLERQQGSYFDWDKETFQRELVKCYQEVPASSSNKPKYLEMIGKVKRFFEEGSTNTYIFSGMSRDSIMSTRDKILSKLNNHSRIQAIFRSQNGLHSVDYRTLRGEKEGAEIMPEPQKEGEGTESGGSETKDTSLNYSIPPPTTQEYPTPPPESSITSLPSPPDPDPTPSQDPIEESPVPSEPEEAVDTTPTWHGKPVMDPKDYEEEPEKPSEGAV